MIRLSRDGSVRLDGWLAGRDVAPTAASEALKAKLIAAGMLHPVYSPLDATEPAPSVAFVVPVYNDADALARLLAVIRSTHPEHELVVVDDASTDATAIAEIAARHQATVLRLATNQGPGAARNAGWRQLASAGEAEVILFLDSDTVPEAGAIDRVVAHFVDESVAAVAPRVQAMVGGDPISRYEAQNSSLDLGPDPSLVYPGTRVSYVPSAALALRVSALVDFDGFDETMRFGEDVDLIWRLADENKMVRYEPNAIVRHRSRSSVTAFARQRRGYGSSAASLAKTHRQKVAPLQLPANVSITAVAAVFGGRRTRALAAAAAAASVVPLSRKLQDKVDEPFPEAARLTALMHRYAFVGMASAATRIWLPMLLPFSRTRRALGLAFAVPAISDWLRDRPANGLIAHAGFRALDHGAYCVGVWQGVWRERSIAAVLPSVPASMSET